MSTDTTTLAPTDAEIADLWAVVVANRRSSNDQPMTAFARAVLAKWGAPAPASGQVVALVKQLVDALEDANADSSEVLGNYTQLYSETYRPHRLLAQQEIVKQGEEAIAAAKEYLAAPPAQEVRTPLDERDILHRAAGHSHPGTAGYDIELARFVESAHGIITKK